MSDSLNNQKPALCGGIPVRIAPFPSYPCMGDEEVSAVMEVVQSGKLSMFDVDFLGGENVRGFEDGFAAYHGIGYGISVNSGTAALHVALLAANVGPGDEVIVPPYTFTATASSVLMANAVPIFADISRETSTLDPEKVKDAVTERTRAVIPVHLFGHPAEMDPILEIAEKYGLVVIEDCAQAPGAEYRGRKVGTFGDLAAFSFQRTKNIMTGEGGMVLTDDADLAHRCRLVRNHGEAFAMGKKREYIANILGWNYRMTEMEAAIGIEQLKKLDRFNTVRRKNAEYLTQELSKIPGITTPYTAPYARHVYGTYVLQYDGDVTGIPKDLFIRALEAEGIPVWGGYPHPLYENPIFREKIVHGSCGCPFSCEFYSGNVDYSRMSCPVTEEQCKTAFGFSVIRPPASEEDMKDIIEAVKKITRSKDDLKDFCNKNH